MGLNATVRKLLTRNPGSSAVDVARVRNAAQVSPTDVANSITSVQRQIDAVVTVALADQTVSDPITVSGENGGQIGWIGTVVQNAVSYLGMWFQNFWLGGTSPATAQIYSDSLGDVFIDGAEIVNTPFELNLNGVTTSIENLNSAVGVLSIKSLDNATSYYSGATPTGFELLDNLGNSLGSLRSSGASGHLDLSNVAGTNTVNLITGGGGAPKLSIASAAGTVSMSPGTPLSVFGNTVVDSSRNAAFAQVAVDLKAAAVTGTSGGTGVGNAMLSATTAGLYLSLNGAAPVALGANVPGGSSTQVQFNNAGAFGGSANFVWDNVNNRLGIGTATPLAPLQTSLVSTSTINEIGAIIERTGGLASGLARGVGIVFKDASNATLVGGVAGIREGPGNDWAGGLGFFTNAAASSSSTTFANLNERMRISGNGNVGIGTITPAQTLHVKSASNEIFSDATTGDATLSTGLAGVRKWSMYNQSAGNNLLIYDWTNSVSRVTVQPGTATAMTILASGNVGIGTTTPAGVLDVFSGQTVSDELYFTNQDSAGNNQNSNSPRLNFVGFGATAGWGIQAVNTGAYSTKDLVFYGHTGADYTTYTERVRFTSGGNVGIGTPIPSAALTVAGDIIGTVFNSSATGATSAFQTSAGTFSITGAGNAAFQQVALALKAVAVTGTSGGTGVGNAMLSATTAGLFLSLNGAAPVALGAGAGTVTSVALTAPSQFTVTGTPITSSGTLAIAWNTQTANTVLAGPASGGAALPTYRALVAADISGLVTPGGSTTQVQYNNAGAFAGAANFAWANATNILTVGPANTAGTGYVGTLFNSSATGATSAFQTSTGTFSITGAGNAAFQGLTLTNRLSSAYYAPAGSNQQIQFNNSGAPGASASLTWNGVTLTSSAMSTSALLVTTSGIGVTGASSITSASAAQTLDVGNTGGGNAIRATAGILVTAGGISVSAGGLSITAVGLSVVGGIVANGNTGFTGTLAAAISAGRNVQYGIIY